MAAINCKDQNLPQRSDVGSWNCLTEKAVKVDREWIAEWIKILNSKNTRTGNFKQNVKNITKVLINNNKITILFFLACYSDEVLLSKNIP